MMGSLLPTRRVDRWDRLRRALVVLHLRRTARRPMKKCSREDDGYCAVCRLDAWCRSATHDQMTDRIFELSELLDLAENMDIPYWKQRPDAALAERDRARDVAARLEGEIARVRDVVTAWSLGETSRDEMVLWAIREIVGLTPARPETPTPWPHPDAEVAP